MDSLNEIVARARAFWNDASPVIRMLLIAGVVIVASAVGYALTIEQDSNLTPISEQPLSLQQVAQVTGELQKRGESYKVINNGTQVLVPYDHKGDLLVSLAAAGVSVQPEQSDGVESSLLATDFQQREHVRQALERSLARDIASMTAIEWAEVHISPGSDSVFSRSNRKGAASVIVKIRPGFAFLKERAISLKHFVSQAAYRYGVTSSSVTVLDHEARTLAPAEDDSDLGLNTKALALQRETEDDLADRIRQLLEPVVGLGRVRVQVRTKMDLNRVEEHAEQYDPENSTVLSERKTSEAARSQRQDPATVAGVQANVPQGQALEAARGRSRSNQDRAVNETQFVVPKVVRHTKHAIGRIQRMSVAVLVDAAAFADPSVPPETEPPPTVADEGESTETEGSEDDAAEPLPPRPNQEMLLALVRDAVAFDSERGDTVTLSFQPFLRVRSDPALSTAEEPGLEVPGWLPISVVLIVGFALIGAAMYMSEKRRRREAEEAARAAEEAAQAEAEEEDDSTTPEMLLKDQVRQIASDNMAATIDVIKGWLSTTPQKG